MRTNRGQVAWVFYGCLMVSASAFLYLCLFRIPFVPIYTGFDENLYLFNATRMLDGQVIYKDFFQFVTPGLTFLDFVLFKLFGVYYWVSGLSLIILGLGLTSLIIVISRKVLQGAAAYLPALLFLTCVYGFGLDNTEHWYSTLAELGAIAIVIERTTPARLASAGALCGLACFFMQTQGVFTVIGLAVFLGWTMRRESQSRQETCRSHGYLLLSFLTTVLATNAYFIFKVGLPRFLYCIVEFPIKYYSADRDWNSFYSLIFELRTLFSWGALPFLLQALSILALVPLVYVWFWVRYRRAAMAADHANSLMLLSIVGFLQFAGLVSAPTTLRLSAATAPGLIILVWLLQGQQKVRRILSTVLWIAAACAAVFLPLQTQNLPMQTLDLPHGPMAVGPTYYENLLWWSQHTHPGEFVYTAAGYETLFPLALRCPAEVESVTRSDFTRPEQIDNIVAALGEMQVKYVFWDSVNLESAVTGSNDVPAGSTYAYLRRVYRSFVTFLGGDYLPAGDHLGPLRNYLRSHYHVVMTFPSSLEVWERNN